MRVKIDTRNGAVGSATRRRLEEVVRLGLGRFARSIEQARVTLGSAVGQDAPHLRTCRIRARLRMGIALTAEARAAHTDAAAESATWQLGHRLERYRQAQLLHDNAFVPARAERVPARLPVAAGRRVRRR